MIYTTMGAVEEPAQAETHIEETDIQEWMIPGPTAQTAFSLVPGIAGGLALIILSLRLNSAKAIEVKGTEVLFSVSLAALATIGSVFLMHTFRSYED